MIAFLTSVRQIYTNYSSTTISALIQFIVWSDNFVFNTIDYNKLKILFTTCFYIYIKYIWSSNKNEIFLVLYMYLYHSHTHTHTKHSYYTGIYIVLY